MSSKGLLFITYLRKYASYLKLDAKILERFFLSIWQKRSQLAQSLCFIAIIEGKL